jgi:replication fork protection complex subunit Tof1/Swi1
MFKDNKLRLLMNLVGFSRLGEAHDPDATWIVPSSLTSSQLQEAIDLIRKYEFAPPTYEGDKGPEDLLRSKASAARRSARRVDFDDDDDGVDNESDKDQGVYGYDEPTARAPDGERKKLKRRKRASTPVELDDEEKDRRAEARRKREIEKQKKAFKSIDIIQDSDDDEKADAAFFAREEALRQATSKAFREGRVFDKLSLDSTTPTQSKKRKAEDAASKGKRRKTPPKRKPQPFADSDDESDENKVDAVSISSAAGGAVEEASEDEATDTPLSSQHAVTIEVDGDTPVKPLASSIVKSQDVAMDVADDDDDDDDDVPVVRRPMVRNTRAGFIIDSDSE